MSKLFAFLIFFTSHLAFAEYHIGEVYLTPSVDIPASLINEKSDYKIYLITEVRAHERAPEFTRRMCEYTSSVTFITDETGDDHDYSTSKRITVKPNSTTQELDQKIKALTVALSQNDEQAQAIKNHERFQNGDINLTSLSFDSTNTVAQGLAAEAIRLASQLCQVEISGTYRDRQVKIQ